MVAPGGDGAWAGDEVIDLRTRDVVQIRGAVWRSSEYCGEGITLLVSGDPPMAGPRRRVGLRPGRAEPVSDPMGLPVVSSAG